MGILFWQKKAPLVQEQTEQWQDRWRSLVPPECRNVPIQLDGESVIAYVCINHFVMMLQDGLLMEETFFPVCEHFQRAGYHVIWLMRCTQDIHNGYVRRGRSRSLGNAEWHWKKPTTNFGRWISDNREATILLQHRPLPDGDLRTANEPILSRVVWATSDDPTKMVPGRTDFVTEDLPASPAELLRWLNGDSLHRIAQSRG